MTRRASRLESSHAAIAAALATAWSEATIVDRRYPTVFAMAMAEALAMPEPQRALFVRRMEAQYRGQENEREKQQLGTAHPKG